MDIVTPLHVIAVVVVEWAWEEGRRSKLGAGDGRESDAGWADLDLASQFWHTDNMLGKEVHYPHILTKNKLAAHGPRIDGLQSQFSWST